MSGSHIDDRPRFQGRIPVWPLQDAREEEAALRVVRSRKWWREAGGEVARFEQRFAAFLGVDHVRAVTNGTDAIELALACLGIKAGDEVLVPATTFIATASAVLTYGAVPIPVDVERDTLCIDAGAAAEAIGPHTRAIIPVHMAGQPCDLDAVMSLARRHGLHVIEDAAHAHGARHRDRSAGSIGRASIFSFQAGKLITAGEGGALATSDPEIAAQTFERHSCGRPSGDREYVHRVIGSNMRMTELQGAILSVQLERLPEQLVLRERRASRLDELMRGIPGVRPLARRPETTRHSHYMWMAWFDPAAFHGRSASDIARHLRAQGLFAARCFPPVHRTEMFSRESLEARGRSLSPRPLPDYGAIATPVAEAASGSVVWFHHALLLAEESTLEEVADEIMTLHRRAP
jgi:3-amino-5-hydroxybenzoate synthase